MKKKCANVRTVLFNSQVTLAVQVFVVVNYFRLCLFIRNVLSDRSYASTHSNKIQNLSNFGIVMLAV